MFRESDRGVEGERGPVVVPANDLAPRSSDRPTRRDATRRDASTLVWKMHDRMSNSMHDARVSVTSDATKRSAINATRGYLLRGIARFFTKRKKNDLEITKIIYVRISAA
jgi:hypothetical protein